MFDIVRCSNVKFTLAWVLRLPIWCNKKHHHRCWTADLIISAMDFRVEAHTIHHIYHHVLVGGFKFLDYTLFAFTVMICFKWLQAANQKAWYPSQLWSVTALGPRRGGFDTYVTCREKKYGRGLQYCCFFLFLDLRLDFWQFPLNVCFSPYVFLVGFPWICSFWWMRIPLFFKGANLRAKDQQKLLPLQLALENGHVEMVPSPSFVSEMECLGFWSEMGFSWRPTTTTPTTTSKAAPEYVKHGTSHQP